MFNWSVDAMNQFLKNVLDSISSKIDKSDLLLVNSYLPKWHEASNELKGTGLLLRPIRKLDQDETCLFSYLFLQNQSPRSKDEYSRAIEDTDLTILDNMFNNYCLRVIQSRFIRDRLCQIVITRDFWLCAVIFESGEAKMRYQLHEMANQNCSMFNRLLNNRDEIIGLYEDLDTMELKEMISRLTTDKPGMTEPNKTTTRHIPDDFSTGSLEEAVKKVHDIGGRFVTSQDGSLRAIGPDGSDLVFGTGEICQKFPNTTVMQELLKKYW